MSRRRRFGFYSACSLFTGMLAIFFFVSLRAVADIFDAAARARDHGLSIAGQIEAAAWIAAAAFVGAVAVTIYALVSEIRHEVCGGRKARKLT